MRPRIQQSPLDARVARRAHRLRPRPRLLLETVAATRPGPDAVIHLVGHSTGGLDARLLLTPGVEMSLGSTLDYRLRLLWVPFRWPTEITAWEPESRFRDEQRRGPYRYWRHSHLFRAERDGTMVEDGVDYDVPGGYAVHQWIVGPDLIRIFTYRQERLREEVRSLEERRVRV